MKNLLHFACRNEEYKTLFLQQKLGQSYKTKTKSYNVRKKKSVSDKELYIVQKNYCQ